jgi:excisionase family DNA binding protein
MTDEEARRVRDALIASFFREWIGLADNAEVDRFRALLPAPHAPAVPRPVPATGAGLRDVLSVAEAAAFLGISKGMAYEACREGQIPHVKIGQRILIPRATLLERLQAEPRGPEPEPPPPLTPPWIPPAAPALRRGCRAE